MSKPPALRRIICPLPDGDMSLSMWRGPENGPVLHWAHANGFNGQTYAPLLAKLSERFTVYAWDARGHGRSTLPADPAALKGWDIYRTDLLAVIDFLHRRHQAPILLGGHSMGGCVSVMAAAASPDKIAGLMLADPVIVPWRFKFAMKLSWLLGPRGEGNRLAEMAGKRRAAWPDIATMEKAYTGRGAFRTWAAPFLSAYLRGGTRPSAEGVQLSCAPAWEAANFMAQSHDSVGPVKNLSSPFTVLMAEHGSTTRAPRLFGAHKHAFRVKIVGGTSHFLPMEKPEQVIAEIHALADHLSLSVATT